MNLCQHRNAVNAPCDTLSFDTLRYSGTTLLKERRIFQHLSL
jgi:hypothetical protein